MNLIKSELDNRTRIEKIMDLSTDFENFGTGLEEMSQQSKNLQLHKTPSTGMSSSLKERLKKCGRYHPAISPTSRLVTSQPQSSQIKSQLELSSSPLSTQCPSTLSNNFTSGTPCARAGSRSRHLPKPRNILAERSISLKQESCSKVVRSSEIEKSVTSVINSCKSPNNGCDPAPTKNLDHEGIKGADIDNELKRLQMQGLISYSSILSAEQHPPVPKEGQVAFCDNKELGSEANSVHASSLPESCEVLQTMKKSLKVQLDQHKESLRKLNMVKTYRTKNDLEKLGTLISKWRSVCQQAILDLHQMTAEPRPSLTVLIQQLGIDAQILGFNSDEECFDAK